MACNISYKIGCVTEGCGLEPYELAAYVGVPQANIAFWERSEKPPRSEVLPKMAEALGVSVEDLLNVGAGKTAPRKAEE